MKNSGYGAIQKIVKAFAESEDEFRWAEIDRYRYRTAKCAYTTFHQAIESLGLDIKVVTVCGRTLLIKSPDAISAKKLFGKACDSCKHRYPSKECLECVNKSNYKEIDYE